MANKINQITIGDSLFIQLDANPVTDGIGYSAPRGSFAYYQTTGEAFVKVGDGNSAWHTITRTFMNGGNFFTGDSLPDMVLGSLNDKNLRFIRNNTSVVELLSVTSPVLATPNVVRLPDHQIQFVRTNSSSSIITNTYLVEPANDASRMNIGLNAQGVTLMQNSNGHLDVQVRTINSNALDTYTRRKRKVSTSRVNIPFAGPSLIIPTISMEADRGRVMITEVTVIVRNVATGQVSQRKETFTIKATDFALGQYTVLFNASDFQYFENPLENMSIALSMVNEPLSLGNQATNTYKNLVTITGLQVGQNYDILIWQERIGMS